jgi:hypothetical protein
MANWKKIIVSGSNAHLAQITSSVLTNDNLVIAGVGGALENSGVTITGGVLNAQGNSIVSTGANSKLTGSFSGSFVGTTDLPDLTQGAGVVPFTYDGSGTATVAVSGAAALSNNAVTKWNGAAFVNSSLTDNGTVVSGTSSIQLSGANSALTGSFTGSFKGDGSQLSGLVTTLDISGSNGSGISIDLKTQDLTITGTANEIETSVAGTTVTIGLPNDVVIGNKLTVTGDLVVNGTTTSINTTNLFVEDKFILLNSGSANPDEGGLVIDEGNGIGHAFVYEADAGIKRWGFNQSVSGSATTVNTTAYAAAVLDLTNGNHADVAEYQKTGNFKVDNGGDIWVWA